MQGKKKKKRKSNIKVIKAYPGWNEEQALFLTLPQKKKLRQNSKEQPEIKA